MYCLAPETYCAVLCQTHVFTCYHSFFRNAKQKIDELKGAVTNGNQRVQEARAKNMKLKEYGIKLMQEKQNLEIQIQQKKTTSSTFHNAAFKPITSPPVTKKNLGYNNRPASGQGYIF